MGWLSFWRKKPQVTVELLPPLPFFIKPQKWVSVNERVGIIARLISEHSAEIHFVGEDGQTVECAEVPIAHIRLARFLQIPKNRRVGLTAEKAVLLGYV